MSVHIHTPSTQPFTSWPCKHDCMHYAIHAMRIASMKHPTPPCTRFARAHVPPPVLLMLGWLCQAACCVLPWLALCKPDTVLFIIIIIQQMTEPKNSRLASALAKGKPRQDTAVWLDQISLHFTSCCFDRRAPEGGCSIGRKPPGGDGGESLTPNTLLHSLSAVRERCFCCLTRGG